MNIHPNLVDAILCAFPSNKNAFYILNALLQGHSSQEIANNPNAFSINMKEGSLSNKISRLRQPLLTKELI